MEAQLKTLRYKRGNLKGRLSTSDKFLNQIKGTTNYLQNKNNLFEVETRLSKLTNLLEDYDEVQCEISVLSGEVEDHNERESFESDYFRIVSEFKQISAALSITDQTVEINSNNDNNSQCSYSAKIGLKLPDIALPKFNGELQNWLEFRDTFTDLIHNNKDLKDIQKYHYLRSSLTGEAAQSIKGLTFSEIDYVKAWSILFKRFNKVRSLVRSHLRNLCSTPSLKKQLNHRNLRNLVDSSRKHLHALNSLGVLTEQWDTLIIYILSEKLDDESLERWDEHRILGQFPTIEEFFEFLEARAELWEHRSSHKSFQTPQRLNPTKSLVASASAESCPLCTASHNIHNCPEFLKLNPSERLEQTRKLRLCINCLKFGHGTRNCRAKTCKTCNAKHNLLLHFPRQETKVEEVAPPESSQLTMTTTMNSEVLLSTASVNIFNKHGQPVACRVLLDSGSQANFITLPMCKLLNLETFKTNISISGISQTVSRVTSKCKIKIQSKCSHFADTIDCYVVPLICAVTPGTKINTTTIRIPSNIKLADPNFGIPGKIDLLLGAELFWQLLSVGQISLGNNMPIIQKTKLGWIISGSAPKISSNTTFSGVSNISYLEDSLTKFWELEECETNINTQSNEQLECERHFVSTIERDIDGRFIASVPLKAPISSLGDSKPLALKRYKSLQRKFSSNPNFRRDYINFMAEYIELGHMTKLPIGKSPVNFLPHHGVVKEESLTTKLRVVFDGSVLTSSGISLNDLQMIGPVVQSDLWSILVRFRQYKFAISADIEKMYRQILVKPEERLSQCILWNFDYSQPPEAYQLNTITYGTTSASFIATRCLKQLALENAHLFPEASEIIASDFYVDDLLTGSDDVENAKGICRDVAEILQQGCFPLRKWLSNSPDVLKSVPVDDLSTKSVVIGHDNQARTLGVSWSALKDNISYKILLDKFPKIVSKRSILSTVARIFDPLGLAAPVTVIAKIMLQLLWREKCNWDESVPQTIMVAWQKFRDDLPFLNNIVIPRRITCDNVKSYEIHGFADASEKAYGACVYLRNITYDGTVSTHLVSAKSKVAPLKTRTIPCLELCAALMLSKLVKQVVKALRISVTSITLWSDSMIVLSWLRIPIHNLKIFVANRVLECNSLFSPENWRYVKSKENPADIISRGMSPNSLISSQLWWHGPIWLKDEIVMSRNQDSLCINEIPELKVVSNLLVTNFVSVIDFERFSNISRLFRCIAFCFRFINCTRKGIKRSGPIDQDEMNNATLTIVKIVQKMCFSVEIDLLQKQRQIKASNICSLSPFLDQSGILRVGGRLRNSDLDYAMKHPILLPANHRFTKLLFAREHLKLHHAGPQQLLHVIRETYWPLSGRNLARLTTHNCLKCYRARPKTVYPLSGNLPKERVSQSHPFVTTGVDYAGPFFLKDRKGRGSKITKCWISLFICFCTKAIHIELISDLTSDSFIAALRRFIGRRGKPREIHSDNATTFVGANNELLKLLNIISKDSDKIIEQLADLGIQWKFIPPRSPHFGGLWEANIKQLKHYLKRTLSEAKLVLEEFNTLLIQIESILNSRPLSPMSSDPNDLTPLTPAHFLIGRTFTDIAEPSNVNITTNRLNRWQYLQTLRDHFWKRWYKECILELQQRTKKGRQIPAHKFQINDLVLIKEENVPPLNWRFGRITALHPGIDGHTRVVSLRTPKGITKRAVTKICPIPSA